MPIDEPAKKRSDDLIDENLKKAFGETLDEGVPDRFADLLAQLKKAAPKKAPKGSAND